LPKVTRADVARLAGVSTAVVSYVVNGGPKPVSAAATARVQDAIERLRYRPNSTARALAIGSTMTIGLVVPDTTNPLFAEYAREIQRAAATRGYALLNTNSEFDPTIELQNAFDLCDRQIDGLLVAGAIDGSRIGELLHRGVRTPTVLIDAASPVTGFTTVGPDASRGTAALVDHLLRVHRHVSVALIIGDSADPALDGRERGWMAGHARNGRRPGPIDRAAFSRQGGYAAGLRLMRRTDRPSAILASSDLQAIGLLRAAHELAVRVPEDLAVASFDGTEESKFSWPALTSAQQPLRAMADVAVNALLEPHGNAQHHQVSMRLIIRSSCGCGSGTEPVDIPEEDGAEV
jgi:LacI family transcriptional regulator